METKRKNIEVIPVWIEGRCGLRCASSKKLFLYNVTFVELLMDVICFLAGFDDLMPLERSFPRFIPRFFGTKLKVIIGRPVTDKIRPLIDEYHTKAGGPYPLTTIRGRPRPPKYEGDTEEAKNCRMKIAQLLKEEVENLGRASRMDGKGKGLKTSKLEQQVTID